MSGITAQDFSKPHNVNGVTATLGAGRDVYHLMPAYEDIPDEFRKNRENPFAKLQRQWFFKGINTRVFVAKPGIDKSLALTHLSAIQNSFEPRHEHKAAGVAYLMSLWFEEPK